MGATAHLSISCTVAGFPEQSTAGSAGGFFTTFKTTNAHGSITAGVATTAIGTAPGIVIPSSATVLYIIPTQSTNPSTSGLRIAPSTALASTEGMYIGYRKPSIINVESTFESTFHVYTTGGTTVAFRAIVL